MIWALENDGAYSIFFLLPLVFPTHKPEEKKGINLARSPLPLVFYSFTILYFTANSTSRNYHCF